MLHGTNLEFGLVLFGNKDTQVLKNYNDYLQEKKKLYIMTNDKERLSGRDELVAKLMAVVPLT